MAKVLITGGLGFIGSNLADRLLQEEHQVVIIDNRSRPGCEYNLAWLQERYPATQLQFFFTGLDDHEVLRAASRDAELIFHLAAQVSVSGSVHDPYTDFQSNAAGTLHLLEAARRHARDPIFIYSSTNKVYGDLDSLATEELPSRYRFTHLPYGVAETQPLDFGSPYGCSKGAGDQYVHDYANTFGLRTIVMRQSCIYGSRQFGHEDQGWVSWFLVAGLLRHPIRIYGDGKQVRDILHINDLLDAYMLAIREIDTTRGEVYNIGGGPGLTRSIWQEFKAHVKEHVHREVEATYEPARIRDQKVYISDIRKAEKDFGWKPKVRVEEGLDCTMEWIARNKAVFERLYP